MTWMTFVCMALMILLTSQGHGLLKPYISTWSPEPSDAVFSELSGLQFSIIILIDSKSAGLYNYKDMFKDRASRGLTVFIPTTKDMPANTSQMSLRHQVEDVTRLRKNTSPLTVMVVIVSDDSTYLSELVKLSSQASLVQWPTKLLILTKLPLVRLNMLYRLLSDTNSVLLIRDTLRKSANAYVQLPYSAPTSHPIRIASWTSHSRQSHVKPTSPLHLFPDKYSVFLSAPELVVAVSMNPRHKLYWTEDPKAEGGRRLVFEGAMAETVKFIARAMNFTPRYVNPGKTGVQLPNGSWTGRIGLVHSKMADFASGPVILTAVRAQAIDYTSTIWMDSMRIVSGRSRAEIDPWSFLLPLDPLVWVAFSVALVFMVAVMVLMSPCTRDTVSLSKKGTGHFFNFLRVVLQQDISLKNNTRHWELVVLGVWLLATLVLTRSYAGNLMSMLAVRFIPDPFQTLRDVLDHQSVVTVWRKFSANQQFISSDESGIFHEVADLGKEGRLKFHLVEEFSQTLDELVRPGHHVFIDPGIIVKNLVIQQFARNGRCDFFISKDGFLPFSSSLITQKGSPIYDRLSWSVMSLTESGLFRYWFETSVPNSTSCNNPPRKYLENSTLSLGNLWGMFVVLCGGGILAWAVFWAELVMTRLSILSLDSRH